LLLSLCGLIHASNGFPFGQDVEPQRGGFGQSKFRSGVTNRRDHIGSNLVGTRSNVGVLTAAFFFIWLRLGWVGWAPSMPDIFGVAGMRTPASITVAGLLFAAISFRDCQHPSSDKYSRKYLIMCKWSDVFIRLAVVVAFAVTAYLWFNGFKDHGTVPAIWVPSILTSGIYFKLAVLAASREAS
jgi:hypothetical protein